MGSGGLAPPEGIKQTFVFNEFHRTKRSPLGFIDFMDGADVGMIQRRPKGLLIRRLRFVNEAGFLRLTRHDGRRQKLERDEALELGCARRVSSAL